MALRGVRGATTADANEPEAIVEATAELLGELVSRNGLDVAEIAYAFFTTTGDLDAEFPAVAARSMGWVDVPLLCGREMDVRQPNSRAVERCIRVVVLYNTAARQEDMRHVYLRGAAAIKRDLDAARSGRIEGALP